MSVRICSVEGCEHPSKSRGWCNMHYQRWQRHGDLERRIGGPVGPRFPFEPLELIVQRWAGSGCGRVEVLEPASARYPDGRRIDRPPCRIDTEGLGLPTETEMALRLGVNRQSIRKYRARGLGPWTADRCATRLGFHPVEVWPDFADWVPA